VIQYFSNILSADLLHGIINTGYFVSKTFSAVFAIAHTYYAEVLQINAFAQWKTFF
jgi:hypothetical protein